MIRVAVILAVAALGVAAAPAPGPTPKQFAALRTANGERCPPIRQLACAPLGDPTEYKCSWQEQFKGKPWTGSTALLAHDGGKWIWLDGGPRCSPLPQN